MIDLALFRNRSFTWGNIANFALGICFGTQLLGLVLWLQEGWGWSAVHTGLAIAPGPVMVSTTAIGLRRLHAGLPDGVKTIIGSLLMGGGGVLIGTSLTVQPHYAAEILPGWLLEGVGVGLAIPTIIRAASAGLAPSQTSTGSAVVQMGRQLGNVLGVAILVIVVGSSTITADTLSSFTHSWWWAGAFAVVAVLACIPLLTGRRDTATAPPLTAESGAEAVVEPVRS